MKPKSFFLNPDRARESFAQTALHGDLLPIVATISDLSRSRDGLVKLHATKDPNKSAEGNALHYRKQFEAQTAKAREKLINAGATLDALERRIMGEAFAKSGLDKPIGEAQAAEIRAVLRSMGDKERDKLLKEAALNGDALMLKAVRDAASPVLYGGTITPIETLINQLLHKTNPDLQAKLDALADADTRVRGAGDAYMKDVSELRDLQAESLAEKQQAELQEAERMLGF